jgi:hypothetical protein
VVRVTKETKSALGRRQGPLGKALGSCARAMPALLAMGAIFLIGSREVPANKEQSNEQACFASRRRTD